jgi:hypothetical protein
MTPSEILTAARELISVPERWTQGTFARTKGGTPTFVLDENAACFCSVGAVHRAMGVSMNSSQPDGCLEMLRKSMRGHVVAFYNDNKTHDHVMRAFDRAIAAAKEQGQ